MKMVCETGTQFRWSYFQNQFNFVRPFFYRYAYGAVEPLTGEGCFLVMSYCNTVCMSVFLKELSEPYSEDIILLCCDGTAWHKSVGLQLPENIILFRIPQYTPEMKPMEQIWKESRKRGFRNEVFATLEKVVTVCVIPFALCLTMSFPALLAEIG